MHLHDPRVGADEGLCVLERCDGALALHVILSRLSGDKPCDAGWLRLAEKASRDLPLFLQL